MLKLKSVFNFFLLVFVFSISSNAYSFTTLFQVISDNPEQSFIAVNNSGDSEGAVNDALSTGFPEIYIIDITQYAYERSVDEFGSNQNVNINVGNPEDLLAEILEKSDNPALIWIEGTSEPLVVNGLRSKVPALALSDRRPEPLVVKELRRIAEIKSNKNTILIERFENYPRNIQKQIVKIIKGINSRYSFSKETVFLHGTVLVAKIKAKKPKDHSSSGSQSHCSSSDKHRHHSSSSDKHRHHHKHK